MKLILGFLMFCTATVSAQTIRGTVHDNNMQPLPGAGVHWAGTMKAAVTDNNGKFSIEKDQEVNKLVISFIGFNADTITITGQEDVHVMLKPVQELKTVEINAKRDATEISTIKPRNIEKIGEKELLKAACCNLSESFETNPTVEVNYADAVTGAKEIQMLGLSGVYTQFLNEAIPGMTGLGSIYGLNYVPGPWMESIQISKGAGSVVNGYEAITGQINIEYKKPETMKERMFINAFADNQGRYEVNTINKFTINDSWNDILMVHGSTNSVRLDMNDDGFMDMPVTKLFNIYNRISYNSGKRLEGQAGFRIIAEDRLGGQMDFTRSDAGTTNDYGAQIDSRRIEVFTKTGMVNPEKPYQSMGLQLNGIYHEHNSWFGLKQYDAVQRSFYANYGYITQINNSKHGIRFGADYKVDYVTEQFNRREFINDEKVPGIYTEYTLNSESKFGIVAGMRADYHNTYGWFYSPRASMKYNFTPEIIARLSGGKGYRTPLVFADNIGVMANSKTHVIIDLPDAEEAWNGGVNVTARFKFREREGSVSADYYYTTFENQYLIDQFSLPDVVLYYNLNGNSTASSIQATVTYELAKGLDIKIAGKLDDVSTDYINRKDAQRPLYSRQRALVNASYETKRKKWRMDATWQWNGTKLLPVRYEEHQHEVAADNESPEYSIVNAQVTKVYKIWEVYAGGENLLNFQQHNPIINADQPFARGFDASSVWGPINGIKVYAGVRIKIM